MSGRERRSIRELVSRWVGFASPSRLRIERFFDVGPLDLTDKEILDFETSKRELLAINMPPIAVILAVAALAFWPFDLIIFANHPAHGAIFAEFRIFVASFLIFGMLVAGRTDLITRAPEHVAGLMSVVGFGCTGWFMARLDGLDGPWFAYLTATPLVTVLILTRLRLRVIMSFAAMGAAWLGLIIADPAALRHPWHNSVMTQYLFTTLLGVMTGHVVFLALRASAVSHERLNLGRRQLQEFNNSLESLVEERTAELRQVVTAAEDVRERERAWVVREIHDALGQELLAVSFSIDLLRKQVSSETAAYAFEPVEELLSRASGSVSRILRGLSATLPENILLADAMSQLVDEIGSRSGIPARFTSIPSPWPRLSSTLRATLFRILQEAVTNVLRHARASSISVHLEQLGERVRLEVIDDGCGLTDELPAGIGMAGIRQRAAECGGKAVWTPGVAGGTRLCVDVPWRT